MSGLLVGKAQLIKLYGNLNRCVSICQCDPLFMVTSLNSMTLKLGSNPWKSLRWMIQNWDVCELSCGRTCTSVRHLSIRCRCYELSVFVNDVLAKLPNLCGWLG